MVEGPAKSPGIRLWHFGSGMDGRPETWRRNFMMLGQNPNESFVPPRHRVLSAIYTPSAYFRILRKTVSYARKMGVNIGVVVVENILEGFSTARGLGNTPGSSGHRQS